LIGLVGFDELICDGHGALLVGVVGASTINQFGRRTGPCHGVISPYIVPPSVLERLIDGGDLEPQ